MEKVKDTQTTDIEYYNEMSELIIKTFVNDMEKLNRTKKDYDIDIIISKIKKFDTNDNKKLSFVEQNAYLVFYNFLINTLCRVSYAHFLIDKKAFTEVMQCIDTASESKFNNLLQVQYENTFWKYFSKSLYRLYIRFFITKKARVVYANYAKEYNMEELDNL